MSFSFLLKATIAVAFSARTISALEDQQVTPYSDGTCTQPLTSFTWDGIETEGANPTFTLGNGVGAPFPAAKFGTYSNLNFQNAATPNNAPGNGVYWSTGPIDPGCNIVFMLPYQVVNYGELASDQPPGNVILAVSQPGCYYTHLPTDAELSMTFCCGGDCDHWVGDSRDGQVPLKKRDLPSEGTSVALPRSQEDSLLKKDVLAERIGNSVTARAASLAASSRVSKRTDCGTDATCWQNAWASCTINMGSPRVVAGLQVAVSNAQTAPSGPGVGSSNIQSSGSVTVGTSTQISSDTTFSTSEGVTVSMEAGIEFPIEASSSVSATATFTQQSSKTIGQGTDNSATISRVNTLGMVPGTRGFMSFTPTYECYDPDVRCGDPTVDNPGYFASICYPQYINGVIQGEYNIVITS